MTNTGGNSHNRHLKELMNPMLLCTGSDREFQTMAEPQSLLLVELCQFLTIARRRLLHCGGWQM